MHSRDLVETSGGSDPDEASAPLRNRIGAILLGVLIVWQLVFMVMSTVDSAVIGPQSPWVEVAPAGEGRPPGDFLFQPTRQWARLTLQTQTWSLFGAVSPRSTFPVVTLVWNNPDGSRQSEVTLPSRFEPGVSDVSFLSDFALVRPFHYEAFFAGAYVHWEDDSVHEQPDAFQEARVARLQARWQPALEFMDRRMRDYLSSQVDAAPPSEVLLSFTVIPTNPPSTSTSDSAAPLDRPYIRWQPGSTVSDGLLPVEAYDPKLDAYFPVPRLP